MIYLVNALCLCFVPLYLPFLALGCLVSSLSVYKLTVIASIELDAVNANRFYGEKLKQAVYEPNPATSRGHLNWRETP